MAKTVTMDEFNAWYERNLHRTWDHSEPPTKRTLEVKYFYFSLDTRTRKIFYIGTNRKDPLGSTGIFGSNMDDHESVLTALEARLNGQKVMSIHRIETAPED